MPELEAFFDSYDVLSIKGIIVSERFKDLDFNETLFPQSILVPEHFECHMLFHLMIIAFHHYTETAFAKFADNFISVSNMLFLEDDIIIFLIVKTIILGPILRFRFAVDYTLGAYQDRSRCNRIQGSLSFRNLIDVCLIAPELCLLS